MTSKLTIKEIVEEISSTGGDELTLLYDKELDCIILINGDEAYGGDAEDMDVDEILENEKRFVPLPSHNNWDFNEYAFMEDFIDQLSDARAQNILSSAIRGRGAFRRFKDRCIDLGIIEQWYVFRENAIREVVLKWCEKEGLEFQP